MRKQCLLELNGLLQSEKNEDYLVHGGGYWANLKKYHFVATLLDDLR